MNRAVPVAAALALAACGPPREIAQVAAAPATWAGERAVDAAPKASPRLVPPEAYLATWLHLFGDLAPLDAEAAARGRDGRQVFDGWDDYRASLGFADHASDLPRATQTNALMIATFDRLGAALCDRTADRELAPKGAPAVAERRIFAFDATTAPTTIAAFEAPFDVLHRTFLGYPARLAPPGRASRFFALFTQVRAAHAAAKKRFTPDQAAWSAVCQGLARHPELHFY